MVGLSIPLATYGQQSGLPAGKLPEKSQVVATHEIAQVRVVVVVRGLSNPWSVAFLPSGDMLITERDGRLRLVRDGALVPEPIGGLPSDIDASDFFSGLLDVAVHPEFAKNRLVYLTYNRRIARGETAVLMRGKLNGMSLTGVEELFAAIPSSDPARAVYDTASRIAFAPDGTIFMTLGGAFEGDVPGDPANAELAQDLTNHTGKLMRLNADGSVPADNPFVGKPDALPEIFSYGHRNQMGLAVHPATGQPFTTEHGMQGGDELNAIEAGQNYGWPLVTYGRSYDGLRRIERSWAEGLAEPVLFWVPSIAPSGLAIYDGDRFPAWKGNLFAGAMRVGNIARTGNVQRLVLSENGGELRRESLLTEFRQRIRDVRQGPDGLLYVLTDGVDAGGRKFDPVLLRLEPID